MSTDYLSTETYYVVWRGDEDDFMFTRLDLDPLLLAAGDNHLSNQQLVQMAWDAEYGDTGEVNPFVGDNPASYDLLEVVGGAPTWNLQ